MLQWIGLVWAPLWLVSIRPTAVALGRLAAFDHSELCKACRCLRMENWRREREWRYVFGAAGPLLMVAAAATIWWAAPILPVVRRLARLPDSPSCAGPPCAAHQPTKGAA